jgi:hypothetical protein
MHVCMRQTAVGAHSKSKAGRSSVVLRPVFVSIVSHWQTPASRSAPQNPSEIIAAPLTHWSVAWWFPLPVTSPSSLYASVWRKQAALDPLGAVVEPKIDHNMDRFTKIAPPL